jgi:hypothetical protein
VVFTRWIWCKGACGASTERHFVAGAEERGFYPLDLVQGACGASTERHFVAGAEESGFYRPYPVQGACGASSRHHPAGLGHELAGLLFNALSRYAHRKGAIAHN